MSCWRELITDAMEVAEDKSAVVNCTLTEHELDVQFDDGYGGTEGSPFTLWTEQRVYFPICYDGAEWVGSASRNPDGKPTEHQGGR